MTTHAGDRHNYVPPRGTVFAGADGATDEGVDERVRDARSRVFDSVDERHQSRWYDAATGQGGEDAGLNEAAENE
jgi:hypothetical protein